MTGDLPGVFNVPRMKQIDVLCVGLTLSDQLLIGAFLQLIAANEGQVFRICEHSDAPVVIFNPANDEAAMLLRSPHRGVAYIQYGESEYTFSRVWRLATPVRLPALREILAAILEQRREWTFSGALARETVVGENFAPVPAHRRLEQILGIFEGAVQSRIPHAISGISGVEIVVFPQSNAVYIECDANVSSWQQALADTQRPVSALSRVGARPPADTKPISFAQFRWELARHLSAGMLLPGLVGRAQFGLTRWPDFGSLSAGSAFDLRIVALIASRPMAIAGMLKTIPYSREGIIALLNGCALVGCLADAPADLLRSVDLQSAVGLLAGARSMPAIQPTPSLTRHTLPTQKPQRAFTGMLSKLRAALGFVPRLSI